MPMEKTNRSYCRRCVYGMDYGGQTAIYCNYLEMTGKHQICRSRKSRQGSLDLREEMDMEQITIEEYLTSRERPKMSCGQCICKKCLYWWSGRCPHGGCYDAFRAQDDPYDKAHPDKPPRKFWSDWNKPGEQAHWCRGGTFFPVSYCEHYVRYEDSTIEECIRANVQVFQDGYMQCPLKDHIGCENCAAGDYDMGIYNCRYMTDSGCNKLIEAKSRMLDAIAAGEQIEPCNEQCCIGCIRQCSYRCGER